MKLASGICPKIRCPFQVLQTCSLHGLAKWGYTSARQVPDRGNPPCLLKLQSQSIIDSRYMHVVYSVCLCGWEMAIVLLAMCRVVPARLHSSSMHPLTMCFLFGSGCSTSLTATEIYLPIVSLRCGT